MTAADVKATYDKIVSPPPGVRSIRKNAYTAIRAIEAPDDETVVFRLKFPSASLLNNLASLWNVIFPKKYLDQDPNYFKTHVEVGAIRNHLGDKVVVQETPMTAWWGIALNNTVKPFDDLCVRKALTLGLDRYTMSKVQNPITGLKGVGGLMRPGTEWAMPDTELVKFPGFGHDIEQNRDEARRLLAEAGYPNGLKIALKNRNVKLPYQGFAVFAIQEWRKIGVEADPRPLETAAWFADGRDTGNFEAIAAPGAEFMDDPDQFLGRYVTESAQNWGRFANPGIDDLFAPRRGRSTRSSASG